MTRTDDSLTSPYRAVRPIATPGDGPWPGMLTCLSTGELRVHVDADLFNPAWRGWGAAPDGHVLAALDVVRRNGGHDVVLPVCFESLDAYLSRRRASPVPLSPGEAVTVGVSLLRGCAELLDGRPVTGAWWLLETGRPVFATDAAPTPVVDGTLALLDDLAQVAPHATAWTDAMAAVSAVRVSAAELDRAEVALFAIGRATPLDLTPGGSRGADTTHLATVTRTAPLADEPEEHRRRGIWESLASHVDADLADAVSRAATSVWRRSRAAPKGRRRAPMLVGAGVAAVVVGVGLMWPSENGDVATAGSEAPSTAVSDSPTASPLPSDLASPREPASADADDQRADDELDSVASALLERLDACGANDECRGGLVMDAASWPRATELIPAERRRVVLLDDFGGVAVLRLDDAAGELTSQLIVIARQDGEWLLRDVHDVAQQP